MRVKEAKIGKKWFKDSNGRQTVTEWLQNDQNLKLELETSWDPRALGLTHPSQFIRLQIPIGSRQRRACVPRLDNRVSASAPVTRLPDPLQLRSRILVCIRTSGERKSATCLALISAPLALWHESPAYTKSPNGS